MLLKDLIHPKPNFIIAVGGGSVIDVAKLVSVLNTDKYTVKDLLETPSIAKNN